MDEDLSEHTIISNMLLEDMFLKNQNNNMKSVSDPFQKEFNNMSRMLKTTN
jgi:hypothetical protein